MHICVYIQISCFGESHPSVAASMLNLASLLSTQGKNDEAQELYQRSLDISNSDPERAIGKLQNDEKGVNGQDDQLISKEINVKDILDMKIIAPSSADAGNDENLLEEDSFFQAVRTNNPI